MDSFIHFSAHKAPNSVPCWATTEDQTQPLAWRNSVWGEEMDVLIKWDGLSYFSPWHWGDSDAGGDSLRGQGRLHRGGDFSTEP